MKKIFTGLCLNPVGTIKSTLNRMSLKRYNKIMTFT